MKHTVGQTYKLSLVTEQHPNTMKIKVKLVSEDEEFWVLDILSGRMKGQTVTVLIKGEGFERRLDEEIVEKV